MVVSRPAFRRRALVGLTAVALTGLLGGCGSRDTGVQVAHAAASTTTPNPPPTPSGAMPTTTAGIKQRACTDIAALRSAAADLTAAQSQHNLAAGQRAWNSLTNAMTDLTATMQSAGSDAGIAVTDVLGPIVEAIGNLDSTAKLNAVGTALKATGPALDAAANHANSTLSCG